MLNVKSIVFFFKRTRISRIERILLLLRKHRKARNSRKHILTQITRISQIYFNHELLELRSTAVGKVNCSNFSFYIAKEC